MSTIQCTKPVQNVDQKQWSSVFPSCDITSEQQSILFVKKLVAVGISSITYLRVIFPEEAYQDHFAEGLNLKLLMNESGCSGASTLISWINGCFDAIEKKYLKQMTLALCIDPQNPNNTPETYTFKFSYSKSGAAQLDTVEANQNDGMGNENKYEVKKPTLKMLRTIIMLTETLRPLPDDVQISMKLLYYDEVTPTDYEPPCFQPTNVDSFNCPEESITYKVGEVSTPFHTVKLKAKISNYMHRGEPSREGATNKHDTNLPQNDETSIQKMNITEDSINDVPTTPALSDMKNYESTTPSITPKLADILSSHEGSIGSMRSVDLSLDNTQLPSQSEYPVRCPCKVNKDQGIMILCDVCGFWQHGACFTIIDESHGPAKHYCNICADPPSLCTDPRLSSVSDEEQVRITCMFRRALVVLKNFEGKMTPAKLAHLLGVDISFGVSIIDKMLADKILKQGKSKRFCEVDKKTLLKSAFPKYLNKIVWQSPENVNSSIKECTSAFQSKNTSLVSSESFVDVEGVDSFGESPLQSLRGNDRSSAVVQDLVVQSSSTHPHHRSLNNSKETSVVNEDSQLTQLDEVIFTKLSSRRFGGRNDLKEVARLEGEISDSLSSTQQTPKKRKLLNL